MTDACRVCVVLMIGVVMGVQDTDGENPPLIPRMGRPPDAAERAITHDVRAGAGLEARAAEVATLPVFRAAKPEMSEAYIAAFINCILGVKPTRVRQTVDAVFVRVDNPRYVVEFNRRLGMILISNKAFVRQIDAANVLPAHDNESAKTAAQLLLSRHHLTFEGAVPTKVLDNCKGAGFYTVLFQRKAPGLKYPVLGNRILVNVSPKGEVHSMLIQWSTFERIADYPIMSVDEAIKEVNSGRGKIIEAEMTAQIKGTVERVTLQYLCAPAHSGYLQPVYRLDIRAEGGETQAVEVQALKPQCLAAEYELAGEDRDDAKVLQGEDPGSHGAQEPDDE
jgi:hypothetical protein